ncbi:MAG: 3-phosphoshikimate 1-carboxyvinyltransferase [Ruminococcaceae bacterium]|nr:3-phosphoshikimate 1-carboxyvinyltransferase [Oscillospiraceae bacterium]
MSNVIFKKAIEGGKVNIPPAKSYGHRSIICAALSESKTVISNMDMSEDMKASLNFLKAMGGSFTYENRTLTVYPIEKISAECEIDCIESGSTLRFIIPIIASLGKTALLKGKGRLPERPLNIYTELLPKFGVSFSSDKLPMKISGKLKSGVYEVKGNISSQFISGLLFALPLLEGDSEVKIIGNLESGAYIDMTIDMLSYFGVEIIKKEKSYYVKGNQRYKAKDYEVEGDWSQAAFFLTMGALSETPVEIKGLKKDSIQGDKGVLELYKKIGARISFENDALVIKKGELNAIEVSVQDMPDAVPALAALMSLCSGVSLIKNAERLRIKESDRLKSTTNALNCLGAQVEEISDGLVIKGLKCLQGGKTASCNDHRILMAMASVRKGCVNDIELTEAECVNKSYPDFYKDYIKLGGELDVIDMG